MGIGRRVCGGVSYMDEIYEKGELDLDDIAW